MTAVNISELRTMLPGFWRMARRGTVYQVHSYGKPVAVLKPWEGEEGEAISIVSFRQYLTDCLESVSTGTVPCYVLTYHRKPRAVFKAVDHCQA